MRSRRRFLTTATLGVAGLASLTDDAIERVSAAASGVADRTPEDVAADEIFWREIQQAFTLDRTLINLNNGGGCPSPRVVHEAFKRYLDISNQAPVYHMWQVLEPNIETVRRRLAAEFGCDTEELAHHAQRQRGAADRAARHRPEARRRGADDQAGLRAHARHLGSARAARRDRRSSRSRSRCRRRSRRSRASASSRRSRRSTKVIHFCHITNLTGQIFPVRDICADGARARHQDDRRRRARVRALPVQAARPRVRLLRHEPAQVAARAASARASCTCGASSIAATWPLTAAAAGR